MCAYIYIKCVTDHSEADLMTLNAVKKWMEILEYKNLKNMQYLSKQSV